jgi:hypothetical protein
MAECPDCGLGIGYGAHNCRSSLDVGRCVCCYMASEKRLKAKLEATGQLVVDFNLLLAEADDRERALKAKLEKAMAVVEAAKHLRSNGANFDGLLICRADLVRPLDAALAALDSPVSPAKDQGETGGDVGEPTSR